MWQFWGKIGQKVAITNKNSGGAKSGDSWEFLWRSGQKPSGNTAQNSRLKIMKSKKK